MRKLLAVLALLITVAWGCGDGVLIISFTSGTIASDPFCDNGTGHFDLQNQGGLLLLVVIGSNTAIVGANGHPGRCTDLAAGEHVQVRGAQHGTQINAQSVNLQ